MKKATSFLRVTLLLSSLAMLPGCSLSDWFKEKACSSCDVSAGEAVVTIEGRPVVSREQFDAAVAALYQERRGIEDFIAQAPEDQQHKFYQEIAENLANVTLIQDYVKREKLDQSSDYKEAAKELHRRVEEQLALSAFREAMNCEIQAIMSKITDEEASKFYLENRDKQPVFQSQPFLLNADKVKAPQAKTAKGEAPKKVAPEYAAYDAVKDLVKQVMMQDKVPALYNEKMESLKKGRNVVINTECLRTMVKKAPAAAAVEAAQAAVAAKPASIAKAA